MNKTQRSTPRIIAAVALVTLASAPGVHAYFDTLPPIPIVVPPVVIPPVVSPPAVDPVVEPPIVEPPIVTPPGGSEPPPENPPPTVNNTPEPATLLMGLSAAGIAGFVSRRRKS